MTILIAVESRHGATTQIADVIAARLSARGLDVEVQQGEDVASVLGYEAVILGSAVYAGHWMRGARHIAARDHALLADRPVFLFSSGPLGDPPFPAQGPAEVEEIQRLTGARAHRVFPGKLDKHELGMVEQVIVKTINAPEGDFRDWDDIRAWADEIADMLAVPVRPEG